MNRILWTFAMLLIASHSARGEEITSVFKSGEVREIAPGVFFRYASASAPNKAASPNNVWIVFEDYVAVVGGTTELDAPNVIAAIRQTTDRPVRYVLNTGNHADQISGNAVFVREGAGIVAQSRCAQRLRSSGPKDSRPSGRETTAQHKRAEARGKAPTVIFDEKLVLDDGHQRVELMHLGHGHTIGDAVAYLPKQKILCTGDACPNGPSGDLSDSDSAAWIHSLEAMQELHVGIVCPARGTPAGKDVLEKQKRYLVELRWQVQQGIDSGKTPEGLVKSIDLPWYRQWTTQSAAAGHIRHVYAELTGRTPAWDLIRDFGVSEGPSPTKSDPGWTAPRRIVVPEGPPARMNELKRIAPDVEFVSFKSDEEGARLAVDADALMCEDFLTRDMVKNGKKLRWIQLSYAGVDKSLFPELVDSSITLTNVKRLYAPEVADTGMALLLSLTRGTRRSVPFQAEGKWGTTEMSDLEELHGKTMLVIGVGGIGTQMSRRAHGFGMRIVGVDSQDVNRPGFVYGIHKLDELLELLSGADVVLVSCPLTPETRGMIGEKELGAMKKTAWLINIARGGIVKTEDLVKALENKQIAGAGLDVTEPEPLPADHPLWRMPNVAITPHTGATSPEGIDRAWRVFKENVRRFVAGEALLCVVDKKKGF
jgi:phosphoglycerate dehydrogenase-like enzyme/glyoxylase-like metal-dependent hydrolase (beta-lactamase superfamily II)